MKFNRLGSVERGWLKQFQALQNEHIGCRWIENDPCAQHPYCGAATKRGSSYCAEHHARAHVSGRRSRAARAVMGVNTLEDESLGAITAG